MATKAEQVETMAKHMWNRVIHPAWTRAGIEAKSCPWEFLPRDYRNMVRDLARWHLRKLQKAGTEAFEYGKAWSEGDDTWVVTEFNNEAN